MLGQFRGEWLPNGQQRLDVFETARLPGNGAFDRIAELARFLLDGDVGIVDLGDRSDGVLLRTRGVSLGTGDAAVSGANDSWAFEELADPVKALKLGFMSQVSVPIKMGQDRIGALAVVSKAARTFEPRDVETMQRLADLVVEGVSLRSGGVARLF